MRSHIFIPLSCCMFFSLFSPLVWAESGYIGEDLGNDIYRRLDEGIYSLKKQVINTHLKGSIEQINTWIGTVCSDKQGVKKLCFQSGVDFNISELDDIAGGGIGPIYAHMGKENENIDTDLLYRIRGIISEYYMNLHSQVGEEQKKLQSIGSIGLFTDGNKDNSSYDLMVDLKDIHDVIFAHEITYDGTENMGASSIVNLLSDNYDHPFPQAINSLGTILDPLNENLSFPLPLPDAVTPPVTLTGILNTGGACATSTGDIPTNIDANLLGDLQSQLLVGTNPNSSVAFSDDGKLPEYWAKNTMKKGGSTGGAGGGNDTFPCSGKDFFCILVSMSSYSQNLLAGGNAATIEKVLDENLKIANKFAPASQVQAKMTKMFFGLNLTNLDLPSMIHIGVVFSLLPPPILNIKPGTTGGATNAGAPDSVGKEDEFNKILVSTFEQVGLDYKRQNSLEKNLESRMVNNLTYLTTDASRVKSDTSAAPIKSSYIQAKEMEIKKSYGDSFNDDLLELHDFTTAFSKSIEAVTSVINLMKAIPQK